MSSHTPRMSGVGRVLVIVYAIMALAATVRSFVQIVQDFAAAPVAYTFSAAAALVYIIATIALVKSDSPRWYSIAWIAICFELAGVLIVGTLSFVVPALFANDAKVWSGFGYGYFWVPLILPFVGIWWLVKARTSADEPAPATVAERSSW